MTPFFSDKPKILYMETLPSELLSIILAKVTKQCQANIPALIFVSKYWKVHCPVPRLSLQLYAKLAVKKGYLSLLRLYYSWKILELDSLLFAASKRGHLNCMRQAKKWGATDFNTSLFYAAYGGHIDCMRQAKKWGATDFNTSLFRAAYGGHIDCMRQAKKWGATDFNWALANAETNSNLDCIRLLKKWGATQTGTEYYVCLCSLCTDSHNSKYASAAKKLGSLVLL